MTATNSKFNIHDKALVFLYLIFLLIRNENGFNNWYYRTGWFLFSGATSKKRITRFMESFVVAVQVTSKELNIFRMT